MKPLEHSTPSMIESRRNTQKRDDNFTRLKLLEKRLVKIRRELQSAIGECESLRKTI